jgi:phosphotransferase system enzyme I (PtsI)
MMIPLVTSIGEVKRVKELLAELRTELHGLGVNVDEKMAVGAMIETPASVEIADLLAPHVDFFSIGTNDLVATTIAVDRTNAHVARLFQPHHPAILRMLKRVFDVGARTGVPVSLCGEMGSDLRYTMMLVGLGLRKFSVVPPLIPEIKRLIRSVTLAQTQALAERTLKLDDADEIERILHEETARVLPDMV